MTRARELGDSEAETRATWRVAIVTTLLALWRYATWMEWLIAWLVVEIVSVPRAQWKGVAAEIRQRLRWRPADGGPCFWRQPLLVLAAVLIVVWLVNLVFRPFGDHPVIAGRTVSFRTGGNLLYAALVLEIVGVTWLWANYRSWFRSSFSCLPVVWRALLAAHVIPMTVWFILPHRLRLFVGTFFFRPEQHKNVYDPLVLIKRDLFALPWLALVLAAIAFVAVGLWWRITVTGRRYLLLCLLISLPVLTVPYETRYALPALVPVVPLVAVTLARLLAEVIPSFIGRSEARRVGVAHRWGRLCSVAVSLALVGAIVVSARGIIVDGLPRPHFRRPEIVTARAAIVDAADGQTESLLVMTDLKLLSPWQVLAEFDRHYQKPHTGIVAEIRLFGREPKVALDETIREHRPEMIIAYRDGPRHSLTSAIGSALLAALSRRADYELLRTTAGGDDGDVIEVWVRANHRTAIRNHSGWPVKSVESYPGP